MLLVKAVVQASGIWRIVLPSKKADLGVFSTVFLEFVLRTSFRIRVQPKHAAMHSL